MARGTIRSGATGPPVPRVVVTGLGLVCALGRDLPSAWPRIMAGTTGVAPIRRFDASRYVASVAAEVEDRETDVRLKITPDSHLRRGTRLFVEAAREAWRDARLDEALGRRHYVSHDIAVAAGTSANYINLGVLVRHWKATRSATTVEPDQGAANRRDETAAATASPQFFRRNADWTAAVAARTLGIDGPQIVADTACSASAHAIAHAWQAIRSGRARAFVAGGGCSLVTPLTLLAFGRIGALSPNRDPATASRPFDRSRDGFVLGEGAAVLVLEDLDAARARGATIYAELAGAGMTTSASSLTDPSPDGGSEAAAMRAALASARIDPAAVGYVSAHGTSTPKNDATESTAIEQVFGGHAPRLMVSSVKGQLGHTLAAAGALNAIAAVMAVARGEIAPTGGLTHRDAACRLDYVPGSGRHAAVGAALANAFAFGGHNCTLAFTRILTPGCRCSRLQRSDARVPGASFLVPGTVPGSRFLVLGPWLTHSGPGHQTRHRPRHQAPSTVQAQSTRHQALTIVLALTDLLCHRHDCCRCPPYSATVASYWRLPMTVAKPEVVDKYVLGDASTELERLISQSRFLGELTEHFLRLAGLDAGMRVLDVGCGAGDVAFVAARIVGPTGKVTAIEMSADSIALAEKRARDAGVTNVTFTQADARSFVLPGPADAAIGRLVLMFSPTPAM